MEACRIQFAHKEKETPCDTCEARSPELTQTEVAILKLYNDVQRYGFSLDIFKAHGFTYSPFVQDCFEIIEKHKPKPKKGKT